MLTLRLLASRSFFLFSRSSCLCFNIFSLSSFAFFFSSSVGSFIFTNLFNSAAFLAERCNFIIFSLFFINSCNFFFLVPSKYCFNSFISLSVKSVNSIVLSSVSIKLSIKVETWLFPSIISRS